APAAGATDEPLAVDDDHYVELDLTPFGLGAPEQRQDAQVGARNDRNARNDRDYSNDRQHASRTPEGCLAPRELIRLATDDGGHSPLGDDRRVCVRLVNRMVPWGRSTAPPLPLAQLRR